MTKTELHIHDFISKTILKAVAEGVKTLRVELLVNFSCCIRYFLFSLKRSGSLRSFKKGIYNIEYFKLFSKTSLPGYKDSVSP